MSHQFRKRVVRDPIHGDIPVGPLQAVLIDTPLFQRLRYIKQNGLLHFVFPGAVHTRFNHSLGTMYMAGRAFTALFPSYRPGDPEHVADDAIRYLGQVFETAALLHDCGHTAFSHSIEHLPVPFLLPLKEYVEEWRATGVDQHAWFEANAQLLSPETPTHEEIGLLLMGLLFGGLYPEVQEACEAVVRVDPSTFLKDVRSLLLPELGFSTRFSEAADAAVKVVPNIQDVPRDAWSEQLHNALSTLISGTIDVDRMDYLIRDSHYTGTVYGVADVGVICSALTLAVGEAGGPTLHTGLRKRACQTVDDFLWSRYQLFAQVLNHKTNVILNAQLARALPEADAAAGVRLGRPRLLEEFLEFTDDFVMSAVISASARDERRQHRSYYRALVGRQLPLYLGRIDVTGLEEVERAKMVDEETARLETRVKANGFDPNTIGHWPAESALIKGGGLPFVVDHDKVTGSTTNLSPLSEGGFQIPRWTAEEKLPAKVQHMHFFVDRPSSRGEAT